MAQQDSQEVVYILNGLPTRSENDSLLKGYGLESERPASGTTAGDQYVVIDTGTGRFRVDVWDGTVWRNSQGDPVNALGGGAQGGVLIRNATVWTTLPAATQYQILQTQGSAADPAYSGQKMYPAAAADPVSPAPADADIYYNTVLDMMMTYDGTRAKWLSVAEDTLIFARNGNTATGAYYRSADGESYSATAGRYTEFAGTIVSLTWTRSDVDSAPFEVTAAGVTIATVASAAISGNDTALNADFTAAAVLGVRNNAAGNTTSGVMGWVRFRWRI